MMQYPYDLPENLMTFCEYSNRFFMNQGATRNIWRQFANYAEVLLHHPSKNEYEQLLCMAIRNELPSLIEMADKLNVHEYPALVTCLQRLIKVELLPTDNSFFLLLSAPLMMKEKRLGQDALQALLQMYPKQQAQLLFYAYLYKTPVNWNKILEEKTHGGLACLALAGQINHTNQILSELYQNDKNIYTLRCWLLSDPESALKALPSHGILEEIIETLVLHGDAKLLHEQAHKLLEIHNEFIIEALKLFFDKQIRTRPGLAQDASCLFETPDPIAVRQMIDLDFTEKQPYILGQKRTPVLINELTGQCTGKAVDYFRLYARYHGHH